MPASLHWIDAFARSRGLRYEPEADERWLRAWEPYSTLKTPFRYEHALHATGATGSVSVARAVLECAPSPAAISVPSYEVGTWIAIVQDVRIKAKAAVTSDFGSPFTEPLELVSMPRLMSGDAGFDHVFASFSATTEDLAIVITPSVRKLLLSWRTPVHAETRAGGFILAPVSLSADGHGLGWMFDAVNVFGEKATKLKT